MSLRQYHSTSIFSPTTLSPNLDGETPADLNRASSLPMVSRGRKECHHATPHSNESVGRNSPSRGSSWNKNSSADTVSASIEPDGVVFKIPRTSRKRSPRPSPAPLERSSKVSPSRSSSCSGKGFCNTNSTCDSHAVQNHVTTANSIMTPPKFDEESSKPVTNHLSDLGNAAGSAPEAEIVDNLGQFPNTETLVSSQKQDPPHLSLWHHLTHSSSNPISDKDSSHQDLVEMTSACHLTPRNSSSSKQKRSQKFRRKDGSMKVGHRKDVGSPAAVRNSSWKQRLSTPKAKLSSRCPGSHGSGGVRLHAANPNPDAIALYTFRTSSGEETTHQIMSARYKMFKCQRLLHQQQKLQLQNKKANPQVVLHLEGTPLMGSYDDPIYPSVFPFTSSQSLQSAGSPHSMGNGYTCTCKSDPGNGHATPNGSADHQNATLGVICRQNGCDTRVDSSLGEVYAHGGEETSRSFTVVPINNETNLLEQERAARKKHNSEGGSSIGNSVNSSINNLRVPQQTFEIEGETTDSLTQNTITSLLSAKFRDVAKRWKQYGVESPRFRKRIHSKWESMNYDLIDSKLQEKQNAEETSRKKLALQWLAHWLIYFFIGVGTAFLAAGVQISVELIAHQKFDLIKDFLDKCSKEDCLIQPVLIWVAINAGITLLGAALVTYVQPMAAGSGIPMIKSYLNGVRIPGLLSLRAFIAKCVGVILSILGGLACGKEGPMAHSGGIMGAGLGKGRIPWFGRDINLYGKFRNDHNIRDLVAAGAASGVSAAFGAPVGGTLFSVEEAASFWNTELVWKVFFSAMIACFSTNFLLSAFEGHPTQLSNPGLVRFQAFPNLTFDLIEIPVFIVLAVIGGLTGSLFVVMNYKLTVFRQKYLHRHKWIKIVEAALVAVVSAIVAFILMYTVKDCTTAHPFSHHAITTKMGCSGDSHNAMSTLFLTTPEGCLKSLLHDPLETYSVLSLVLFIIIFFLLGVWTYGLSVSSGVFIPSLAIGAAWGRLIGMGVVHLFPDQAKDVGKYALIGAASQLGGILRTTISLTVIIVECTGDISFGLCIMIALMISKWVGDFFTTGLYDMNVEVSGIPLLSWEPPPLCDHVKVSDFMSQPVMSLLPIEKVGHVVDCLKGETFHGFPVIEQDPHYDLMYRGKLKGLILRSQLLVLLQRKVFCKEGQSPRRIMNLKDFDNPYPVSQRLNIDDIELTDEDRDCVMDLTTYMSQTPYVVSPNFSMPRAFRLFRGLGLRHLVVVNDNFEPVGMITRKDLAVYRAGVKKGMLHMEQLTVENK